VDISTEFILIHSTQFTLSPSTSLRVNCVEGLRVNCAEGLNDRSALATAIKPAPTELGRVFLTRRSPLTPLVKGGTGSTLFRHPLLTPYSLLNEDLGGSESDGKGKKPATKTESVGSVTIVHQNPINFARNLYFWPVFRKYLQYSRSGDFVDLLV